MQKALCSIFLFVLTGLCSYGQTGATLSPAYRNGLYRALSATSSDTVRLRVLNQIGAYYLSKYTDGKPKPYSDSALSVLKDAVALSETIHLDDVYNRYESLRLLGATYLLAGDSARARYYMMRNIGYYSHRHQTKELLRTWTRYGSSSYNGEFYSLAMQCYVRALAIAINNHIVDREPSLKNNINWCVLKIKDDEEAFNSAKAILKRFKGQQQNFAGLYWALARRYRYKGDMKSSLFYGLASINEMELYKDTADSHIYYGEVAQIYQALGQAEQSVRYYRITIKLREQMQIPEEFILRTAGFLIQELIKLGKFKEALTEATAVEARNPPKTLLGEAIIAQNKAYCYQGLKDNAKAEKYYVKMMTDFDRLGHDDEIRVLALYDIGNFYASIGKYDKAKIYTRRLGNPVLSFDIQKSVELLLFQVDSGVGNYKDAMQHYIQYQKLQDSIFNNSKSKEIAELQIKYESSQKQKDIELLKKDSQLQRDRAKQSDLTRNLTLAGIGLLSIALVFLISSLRSNQKKSHEIDLKNESLNLLITEKDALLQEKEWLIKEVHHRVKNNLQIVMGLLQRQSSFVDNEEALMAIQNSEHRMHSIALIHQKLYQSDNYSVINIADYVAEMIGYLQESFDLKANITFEKKIPQVNLDINTAVPLGLIINEAITNAIKYAFPVHEPGFIQISLHQTGDDTYTLQIADNGCGLPADFDIKKINSMGFNLMRGLSKQLSGTFMIDNINGVSIRIDFKTDKNSE